MTTRTLWLAVLCVSMTLTVLLLGSCSNHHIVSIAITPQNPSVAAVGQTTQFTAMGTSNDAHISPTDVTSTATWTSSTASVATISASGLATATGCGTTTINAEQSGITGSTQLTISCSGGGTGGGNPVLQSVSIYPGSPSVPQVNQTVQFIALAVYVPASSNNDLSNVAKWSSSNQSIATVNSSGQAMAVGCGTTTITAEYQGIVASTNLTVSACDQTQDITSITVSPSSATVSQTNEQTQFIAIGKTSAGDQTDVTSLVSWSSSNPGAATVSNTGLATALLCETTQITAEYNNSLISQGTLTVSCTPPTSIEVVVIQTGSVHGTVVSSPAGIDCGTTCGATFSEGMGMSLTATPTPSSWTNCPQPLGAVCYFTVEPDIAGGTQQTITANF